jgi:hypothetical protein
MRTAQSLKIGPGVRSAVTQRHDVVDLGRCLVTIDDRAERLLAKDTSPDARPNPAVAPVRLTLLVQSIGAPATLVAASASFDELLTAGRGALAAGSARHRESSSEQNKKLPERHAWGTLDPKYGRLLRLSSTHGIASSVTIEAALTSI